MALIEAALMPGEIPHMIEFSIIINDQFVCSQRAVGLIVATPTGSTAYALSGGGPILHPQLDAFAIVPKFPHTLSARPIVVKGDSVIKMSSLSPMSPHRALVCDGQVGIVLPPGSHITIKKKAKQLRLIHPRRLQLF